MSAEATQVITAAEVVDECWEWNGTRDRRGYGQRMLNYQRHYTHRLAWAWANSSWDADGPYVPFGMFVLHKCDNPPCCNPSHLYLGTQADNMADKSLKRRHHHQRKTHCPSGHPYSGDNTKVRSDGSRICKTCRLAHHKLYHARHRDSVNAKHRAYYRRRAAQ